jgi:hypothetical protein
MPMIAYPSYRPTRSPSAQRRDLLATRNLTRLAEEGPVPGILLSFAVVVAAGAPSLAFNGRVPKP